MVFGNGWTVDKVCVCFCFCFFIYILQIVIIVIFECIYYFSHRKLFSIN